MKTRLNHCGMLDLTLMVSIVILVVAGFLLYMRFNQQDDPKPSEADTSYATQAECESVTRQTCQHVTCDYIPEGKTFDEVCGVGFVKGWQAVSDNNSSI